MGMTFQIRSKLSPATYNKNKNQVSFNEPSQIVCKLYE